MCDTQTNSRSKLTADPRKSELAEKVGNFPVVGRVVKLSNDYKRDLEDIISTFLPSERRALAIKIGVAEDKITQCVAKEMQHLADTIFGEVKDD